MSVYPTEAGIDDRGQREARPVGAVERPPPKDFSRLGIRDADGVLGINTPERERPPRVFYRTLLRDIERATINLRLANGTIRVLG